MVLGIGHAFGIIEILHLAGFPVPSSQCSIGTVAAIAGIVV